MLDLGYSRAGALALVALTLASVAGPANAQVREDERSEREWAPRVTVNGRSLLYANRGRLGVSITSNQDDPAYAGALISEVTEDGPADEAGLRAGDVITAIDGQRLLEPLPDRSDERDIDLDRSVPVQRLMALLSEVRPGDEVEVTYERDGEENTVTVVADELGGQWTTAPGFGSVDGRAFEFNLDDMEDMRVHIAPQIERIRGLAGAWGFSGFGSSGLELAELNPELGAYFGAEEGVLVLDVDEDTTLGLEPGDVLLDIDGRTVRDREHARRILGSYEANESVSFGVIRQGTQQTVDGRLPDHRRRHRRGGLRN